MPKSPTLSSRSAVARDSSCSSTNQATRKNLDEKREHTVPLETFARIAVLVEYYTCHEALEVLVESWNRNPKRDIPGVYCRKLILRLLITWGFSNESDLKVIYGNCLVTTRVAWTLLGFLSPKFGGSGGAVEEGESGLDGRCRQFCACKTGLRNFAS